MGVYEKMTTLADAIRSKTGGTDLLTLDGMAEAVNGLSTGNSFDGCSIMTGTITCTQTSAKSLVVCSENDVKEFFGGAIPVHATCAYWEEPYTDDTGIKYAINTINPSTKTRAMYKGYMSGLGNEEIVSSDIVDGDFVINGTSSAIGMFTGGVTYRWLISGVV